MHRTLKPADTSIIQRTRCFLRALIVLAIGVPQLVGCAGSAPNDSGAATEKPSASSSNVRESEPGGASAKPGRSADLEIIKRREIYPKGRKTDASVKPIGVVEWRLDPSDKSEYIFVRDRNHRLIGHILSNGATYKIGSDGKPNLIGNYTLDRGLEILYGSNGPVTGYEL